MTTKNEFIKIAKKMVRRHLDNHELYEYYFKIDDIAEKLDAMSKRTKYCFGISYYRKHDDTPCNQQIFMANKWRDNAYTCYLFNPLNHYPTIDNCIAHETIYFEQ